MMDNYDALSEDFETVKKRMNSFQHFFDIEDTLKLTRTEFSREYKKILRNANLLKHNVFVFQNPLDMEPCHIPYERNPIDWLISPNGDPEWLFMLHRQEYLFDLVIAYLTTKEQVYIQTWKHIVMSWIDNHQLNEETKSIGWRTIDTGIRCYYWCRSLVFLLPLDVLEKEEINKIITSMRKQMQHIHDAYLPKHDLSNWGILQTAGVLICEIWMGELLQTNLKDWSIKKLKTQLDIQVNRNGVHWEQSPMYQFESLYYLVSVVHHASLNRLSLDESFLQGVRRLSQNSLYQIQPNGNLIPQSDTDDTNLSFVLKYAEIVLNERFIPFDQKVDDNLTLLWLVGYSYLYNENFRDSDYDKLGISLDNWDELTGNSWSRSDWTNRSDYVTVHSGPVGSGHGHLDLGHFNYVYHGIPVYIDSGRYTYMTNPIRTHLKSVYAHNTLLLDNEPFSYPKDSWTYYKTAEPLSFYACSDNHTHITELSYIARLSDGMFYMIRRRVIFIKVLSSVVISDFVVSEGTHHATRLFHVAPDVKAELETSDCCRLETSYGNIKQHFFSDTNLIVNTSFVSPVYNKLRNTKVIQADNSFKDEGSFLTVIAPSDVKVFKDEVFQSGSYEKVNSLFMDALVLKNGEYTKTVLQSQKDTVHGHKLYFYEKIPFYGRLNIMDSDGTINRFL